MAGVENIISDSELENWTSGWAQVGNCFMGRANGSVIAELKVLLETRNAEENI